ncbi:MAG TPA: hypothetical protein VKR31_15085 [Rhizomicrobium sp.]|nr:hypothetical protein [Rhizomicrobium sp.]
MSEIPALTAAGKRRRDVLGQLCFALHLGVMVFIVVGWAVPQQGVLLFYLVLLPAVVVQWQFNRNSCVLNNLESLFRTGRWRDPGNAEEGAWLAGVIRSVLRLELRPAQLDVLIYVVMALFWGLALHHLLRG